MVEFAENGGILSYTLESIKRTFFSRDKIGEISGNRSGWTAELPEWAVYCEHWLRNYASQGILQRIKGILFGRPGGSQLRSLLSCRLSVLTSGTRRLGQ
jgi:hypothetical protein